MDSVVKYRLWCNTESKWEYIILEENENAPTTCPADPSHTIDTTKTSIIDSLEKANTKVEQQIPAGGSATLFEGFSFTATAGQVTQFDYKITQDFYLNEGEIELQNHAFADKIVKEIVDVDGLIAPAGTVLRSYIKNYPLRVSGPTPFKTDKKTAINLNGFYIRVKYTSTGGTNVEANVRMRGFDS